MRWLRFYLVATWIIAVVFWSWMTWQTNWSYKWYTGKDDPFWETINVSSLQQVFITSFVASIGGAIVLFVRWLISRF